MPRKPQQCSRPPVRKQPRVPSFIGAWTIVEEEDSLTEPYADDPGAITFEPYTKRSNRAGRGRMEFGCLHAEIDWREDGELGLAEFSWEGHEEGDQLSGRGKAWVDEEGRLRLTVWYHHGEKFLFICERSDLTS